MGEYGLFSLKQDYYYADCYIAFAIIVLGNGLNHILLRHKDMLHFKLIILEIEFKSFKN